jgi:LacI family transcriptional regulator
MARRRTPSGKQFRVALLIETSTSWGAQIVRGIGEYAQQQNRPWTFYIEPRGRNEQLHLPTGWQGDGIIARVTTGALCAEIVAAAVPAVNVSWFEFSGDRLATCTVDEAQVGKMAGEYFLDRGYRHFAYCGPLKRPGYTDRMQEHFVAAIGVAGMECACYRSRHQGLTPKNWQTELTDLGNWLRAQPKPLAVLSWSATRGRHVTEACQHASLSVPEEVAVLGGEFDELMSSMSSPPLSTIDVSAREVGLAAAARLHRGMAGGRLPKRPQRIAPRGVITRQSTDMTAIDEAMLAAALTFIREHAHEPIRVDDLLQALSLSRRRLEQRFIELLGRSPAAEIRRTRLSRAERLLADTDLPIPEVAAATGFSHPETLTRTFRRERGLTPLAYRRRHR